MTPQVLIAGLGMVPFRRPGQRDPYDIMAEAAVRAAATSSSDRLQGCSPRGIRQARRASRRLRS